MLSEVYFSKPINDVTLEDIQNLIDRQEMENNTLEYTEIPKKPSHNELTREILAFLNTRGGFVIFGVSERNHKYPYKITWGTFSKEDLVRNLYNKVIPWYENIEICPIENPENKEDRIFIIEIPKSPNLPHVGSEKYWYRNVFENCPRARIYLSLLTRNR